jgi:CheY-like chemotaxis protein
MKRQSKPRRFYRMSETRHPHRNWRLSNKPLLLSYLVVEDDALIGMLLGDMLEVMGREVCAIEATELSRKCAAARCAPNMMIVDANLQEGSGLSAVDQILRKGFVPHVFVTGDLRGVSKLRPDAVVIAKPFTEATLSQAMARARRTG